MNRMEHKAGFYTHKHPGPLLVFNTGIHGNEQAGIKALQKVFKVLTEREIPVKGAVLGLIANVSACEQGIRYISEDMNRIWTEERLELINQKNKERNREEIQVYELIQILEEVERSQYEDKYFIDFHTTSSESIPYISVGNKPECRSLAKIFPMHTVQGFGDLVDGTIDKWFCKREYQGFTVEAGSHGRLSSVENCEAIMWLALIESGCVDLDYIRGYKGSREVLAKFIFDDKKNFRLVYRHSIAPFEDFRMEPDFVNFQKICKGELLAHIDEEALYSQWDARILMPLYQTQGEDGFFIIEEL